MIGEQAWLVLGAYLTTLLLLVRPLGLFMARVLEGRFRYGRRVECLVLRACGIDPDEEMNWRHYAAALLLFNGIGLIVVYGLQRFQSTLPFNPQGLADVRPDLALNVAVSFVTNTDWQAYVPEQTVSVLTQVMALTVQNFLSAASGIAVAAAFVRGLARHSSATIGNAWVDIFRVTVGILLPLSLLLGIFLVSCGVVQTFEADLPLTTLEASRSDGVIAAAGEGRAEPGRRPANPGPVAAGPRLVRGPVASQEAIKLLGTNGGGYFNANSAHPYENPSPLVNFVQMLAILWIPGALCLAFGRMVGDDRQGWTLLLAMSLLFAVFAVAAVYFEMQSNPPLEEIVLNSGERARTTIADDGNWEGKEVRFGIAESALFATVTTAASCGAVNALHDSFSPLGGAVPLVLMQLGEVVLGGAGSGLYGLLIFAVLAVFIAGLMIGRTPEYLGKRIEAREMQMTAVAILITPLLVLLGTSWVVSTDVGRAAVGNPGVHGFSEILYALSSTANNNGSAFAGLTADTPFFNLLLAAVMVLGRFGVIVPVLAMSGSLAAKPRVPVTAGTLPTHGPLFALLLIATVLLVGLLNYVPALALGPLVEQLLRHAPG